MDAEKPEGFENFDSLMRKLIKVPPEAVAKDWRIGISVKVKYRTHELYYEPPHKVIDVFPNGHAGIVDKDGVLKLESASGKVFLARADDWITA